MEISSIITVLKRAFFNFDESKIKRDADGKFAETGGGGKSAGSLVSASQDRSVWPEHIKKQKIPPGWTDIKYSKDSNPADGVLAIGVDSKGRKQYVYSPETVKKNQEEKFKRVKDLEKKHSAVEKKIQQDMTSPAKAETAECMLLISRTGLRPGSEVDTKAAKEARGASTLLGENVKIDAKGGVKLEFTGKKGVDISLPVTDKQVADILRQRKQQAGDAGKLFQTNERKLSAYAKELGGFKTKDFRTRLGTATARSLVKQMPKPQNEKEVKKQMQVVAKQVAAKLGNTPAVALSAYIAPDVFAGWSD